MDHGAKWETSVLMGGRAELVDLARFGSTLEGRIPDPKWGISPHTDPSEASLDLGERYVAHISENLARKAQQLLRQACEDEAQP